MHGQLWTRLIWLYADRGMKWINLCHNQRQARS